MTVLTDSLQAVRDMCDGAPPRERHSFKRHTSERLRLSDDSYER